MKRLFLSLIFLFEFVSYASAATCFWVGGVGNVDSINSVSWSSSSGGTVSTCAATGGIPKNAGDVAKFDASSGGGTLTVCGVGASTCPTSSGVWSLATIDTTGFTGTLDYATNNPNVTATTSLIAGSGTKTINAGSGLLTLSAVSGTLFDCATCGAATTYNTGTSTILLSGTTLGTKAISLGTSTHNKIQWANVTVGTKTTVTASAGVVTNMVIGSGNSIAANNGTITIATLDVSAATSSAPISFFNDNNGAGFTETFALGAPVSANWLYLRGMIFSTNTLTAANSFNGGGNSGTVTITAPATGGGGGRIIGG